MLLLKCNSNCNKLLLKSNLAKKLLLKNNLPKTECLFFENDSSTEVDIYSHLFLQRMKIFWFD